MTRDPTMSPDNRLRALKLFSELIGLMERSGQGANGPANRVMVVPIFNSEDDWEKAAAEQQRKLLSVARD